MSMSGPVCQFSGGVGVCLFFFKPEPLARKLQQVLPPLLHKANIKPVSNKGLISVRGVVNTDMKL